MSEKRSTGVFLGFFTMSFTGCPETVGIEENSDLRVGGNQFVHGKVPRPGLAAQRRFVNQALDRKAGKLHLRGLARGDRRGVGAGICDDDQLESVRLREQGLRAKLRHQRADRSGLVPRDDANGDFQARGPLGGAP